MCSIIERSNDNETIGLDLEYPFLPKKPIFQAFIFGLDTWHASICEGIEINYLKAHFVL